MSLFKKTTPFTKNMFSKDALFWHTSQLKTYQQHQNNSQFNLTFFDKHVSSSCWLFWAALYQNVVSGITEKK